MAPHSFNWIQFRRVCRQLLNMEPCMFRSEFFHFLTAMNIEVVPDYEKFSSAMSHQSPKKCDHFRLFDRSIGMQRNIGSNTATCWRNRDRTNCRDSVIMAGIVNQHRCFTAYSPSTTNRGSKKKSCFIDKSQRRIQATGSFFMRSQSRWTQLAIPASSRCLARRVGF